MLKNLGKVFMVLAVIGLFIPLSHAGDVEFVSTGEGDKSIGGGADAIADDPYKGKQVTEQDEAGSKLTQREYKENCDPGDDLCKRAKQRQTSQGDTWKEDVKEGRRGSY